MTKEKNQDDARRLAASEKSQSPQAKSSVESTPDTATLNEESSLKKKRSRPAKKTASSPEETASHKTEKNSRKTGAKRPTSPATRSLDDVSDLLASSSTVQEEKVDFVIGQQLGNSEANSSQKRKGKTATQGKKTLPVKKGNLVAEQPAPSPHHDVLTQVFDVVARKEADEKRSQGEKISDQAPPRKGHQEKSKKKEESSATVTKVLESISPNDFFAPSDGEILDISWGGSPAKENTEEKSPSRQEDVRQDDVLKDHAPPKEPQPSLPEQKEQERPRQDRNRDHRHHRSDRPRSEGDRPQQGDRPRQEGRREQQNDRSDRPRSEGDRPQQGDRPRQEGRREQQNDRSDRPRSEGDRPQQGDRPRQEGRREQQNDRSDHPRSEGDRPQQGDRPRQEGRREQQNDRSDRSRSEGDRPQQGDRPRQEGRREQQNDRSREGKHSQQTNHRHEKSETVKPDSPFAGIFDDAVMFDDFGTNSVASVAKKEDQTERRKDRNDTVVASVPEVKKSASDWDFEDSGEDIGWNNKPLAAKSSPASPPTVQQDQPREDRSRSQDQRRGEPQRGRQDRQDKQSQANRSREAVAGEKASAPVNNDTRSTVSADVEEIGPASDRPELSWDDAISHIVQNNMGRHSSKNKGKRN